MSQSHSVQTLLIALSLLTLAVARAEGADLDVTHVWFVTEVRMKMPSVAGTPSSTFAMTAKEGHAWVAVEAVLTSSRTLEPMRIAFATLIDSTGTTHKMQFAYPASIITYTPFERSIFFDGSTDAPLAVSTPGSKVVAMFLVPGGMSKFRVSFLGAPPVPVEAK